MSESQPLRRSIAGQLQAVKDKMILTVKGIGGRFTRRQMADRAATYLPNAVVTISVTAVIGIGLILWFGGLKPAGWWQKLPGISPPPSVEDNDFNNEKIRLHIIQAASLRDTGAFSRALAELEKARSIDPKDTAVKAEIERTRRVCLAEKKLGLTEERCD